MATIRQIEIFLHLAQVLHFNRAAEELGISQAALSKEIGKLEKSLGCQLFDRSDRWAIRLSSAGKAYQAAVSALPEVLNSAQQLALRAARGESGELSVAIANLMYDYLQLEDVLRAMHEKYPEVKIIIRDCQASPLVYEQVKSGQADIGFMAINNNTNYTGELHKIKLMELPMNLGFPKNHPLAAKKDLQIRDLANCNFILPPMKQAPWLRKNFEDIFLRHCGKLPLVEQEALGIRATRQLVAAGLGIGVMVQPPGNHPRDSVVYRSLLPDFKRVIVAAWADNNQSQTLKNFVVLLNEFAQAVSKS
jgi:DNA-binding transcriptional LysR family regulator